MVTNKDYIVFVSCQISSNIYKLIGSFAIIIGILLIMGFRLVEKNYSLSIKNSYLKKIIFYKF